MLRYCSLFYSTFLMISYGSVVFKVNPPKITMTKSFAPCPNAGNLSLIYKRIGRAPPNSYYLIENYDIAVKEDLLNPIGVQIENERCESRDNPGTCSHFSNFKSRHFCTAVVSKNEFWSPFISGCLDPSLRCPIRKGVYKGRNCTINVKALTWLTADCSYWKLKLRFIDLKLDRQLACSNFEALIC